MRIEYSNTFCCKSNEYSNAYISFTELTALDGTTIGTILFDTYKTLDTIVCDFNILHGVLYQL